MEVGTEVWVKCNDEDAQVWAPGVVLDCQAVHATGQVKIKLEQSGEIVTRTYMEHTNPANELFVRNRHDVDFTQLPCLIGLEHLHEPALLHALSERFRENHIYTYIGDILLAVNPFKELGLYTSAQIQAYQTATSASARSSLPPHVFAIADKAFRGLIDSETGRNQSILVSGESGSGKTETTKFLMQFLTAVGSSHSDIVSTDVLEIGKRILQTNPILESFGNARTIRNDNSSRFGKFIKLQFGAKNEIIGAEIASYLLEKCRLIHQSPEERSFHIFYELIEGTDAELLQSLGLSPRTKYQLLNHYEPVTKSKSASTRKQSPSNRTHYGERFAQTVEALEDTGVEASERERIFQVLAALLHLGNVNFTTTTSSNHNVASRGLGDEGGCVTKESRVHLIKCAELLGVPVTDLESLLLTREITAGSDVLLLRVSASQAKDVCQSVAKTIYGRLFTWLVGRLSDGINYRESLTSLDALDDEEDVKTIGILDIFGFESLDTNGFEQLCINYANERLQAQFNEFVFVKEQETYMSEGIEWRSIPFPSNAACLALFDEKPNGLFSLLDQECVIPKGSNQALSTKFYRCHGGGELLSDGPMAQKYTLPLLMTSFGRYLHPSQSDGNDPSAATTDSSSFLLSTMKASVVPKPFSATKMDRAKQQFVIHHFAGNVRYRLEEFLEKNQDLLPADASQLLLSSSNEIVNAIGLVNHSVMERRPSVGTNGPDKRRSSSLRGPSVSAQFKSQLDLLIDEINHTEAHYIRCLKPNEEKRADVFDRMRVVEQLRSVGVLEALRVARAGYAVRLSHESFVDRFCGFRRFIRDLPVAIESMSPRMWTAVIAAFLLSERKRCTLSKYLEAMDDLDALNALTIADGLQVGRTLVFCKRETYDYFLERRTALRESASVLLQRQYRTYRVRKQYVVLQRSVIRLQAFVRGAFTRKQVALEKEARIVAAVQIIQRSTRRWLKIQREKDEKLRLHRLRRGLHQFQRGCLLEKEVKHRRHRRPYGRHVDNNSLADAASSATYNERYASDDAYQQPDDLVDDEDSEWDDRRMTPASLSRGSSRGSRQSDGHRTKASKMTKPSSSSNRKKKGMDQHHLESEIVRLKQLLAERESQRSTSQRRKGRYPTTQSRYEDDESEYDDRHHAPMMRERRTVRSHRSLSLDGMDFSEYEDHSDLDHENDDPNPDEEEDEDRELPLPRRAKSVFQPPSYRQSQHHHRQVSSLTRKIEELDAKCQFLENLVARGSTYEQQSRNSFAYSQRSSASSNWERHKYGDRSSLSSLHQHHSAYPPHASLMHDHAPPPPSSSVSTDFDNHGVEGMLRNLQQQMEMLRQSVALKDETTSISSSHPTRSSTAASAFESAFTSRSIASSSSPRPSVASTSPPNVGLYPAPYPPTPLGLHTPRLPPRSAPAQLGGGPRIVKWARANECFECEESFSLFVRRHHCRMCGNSFCHEHSSRRVSLFGIGFDDEPVRVCDNCFLECYASSQDPYAPTPSHAMLTPSHAMSTPRYFMGSAPPAPPQTPSYGHRQHPYPHPYHSQHQQHQQDQQHQAYHQYPPTA